MSNEVRKRTQAQLFEELERIANVIPTPLYWLDTNGILLGLNDETCNHLGGLEIRDKLKGKLHDDYYPEHVAKNLNENTRKVIESGQIVEFEEEVVNITTGDAKYYTSIRSPLRDDDGNIIGTIGTSVDITAKKEAERLHKEAVRLQQEAVQLELKSQEQLLQEKEKLITLAHTVAHDISSPISALNMMMHACNELPEKKRLVIKRAIESILDIANNLLSNYRNEEQRTTSEIEQRQPLLISDLIVQLLSEKKAQYSNHAVRFETEIANDAQFSFAQMQTSQFRRSLSNLINNAVDALANIDQDTVTITLSADDDFIVVKIQDNGKGMSSDMIQKMMNRQSFTEGKANGHGIGLQQVWDTLDNNQGTMTVSSIPNDGTTIQLTFPRICAASWIAQTIHLVPNSITVILDDEESIHGAWDTRFVSYLKSHPTLAVHHFKQGQEALDFFSKLNSKDKDRVVFLSDYELLRQAKNGLQIIEESGIKNTTLVTSYYANSQIRDKALSLGVKILPKQMASIVPIEINENRSVTHFLKAMRNRFSSSGS
jgi:PAS domain S-box-containing protein